MEKNQSREPRRLLFSDDPMFKRVMEREDICRGVIERIIRVPVGKVVYHNTEQEVRGLPWGKTINMARDFWTRHRLSKEKPLSSPTSEGKGGERPCRRGESRTRRTRRTSSPNA